MAVPVVAKKDRTQQSPAVAAAPSVLVVRPVLSRWERLQRRREDRRRRRADNKWVSFRGAVFLVMFAAVLVGAYLVLRWYGTQDYRVAVRGHHVVVIQGRVGGFLWWQPRVVFHEAYGPLQLPTQIRTGLQRGLDEPSLLAAERFINTEHHQWAVAHGLATVPSSTTTTIATSNFTTTTTAATTGGT